MASAVIREEQRAAAFSPDLVKERMKWVMVYDLLGELAQKLPVFAQSIASIHEKQDAETVQV
jgi:salicylate hydroxylase